MNAEIIQTLDYLCQQLGELDVATILPDDIERRDVVINRAIDVRTACMRYLTSHIRATPSGTIGDASHFGCASIVVNCLGKVTKRIFKDERITDAVSHLKFSIDSYNNALGNINLRINIKLYELLKGTYTF